jgi:hypothetical protein
MGQFKDDLEDVRGSGPRHPVLCASFLPYFSNILELVGRKMNAFLQFWMVKKSAPPLLHLIFTLTYILTSVAGCRFHLVLMTTIIEV